MSSYPKFDDIDPLSLTSVQLECYANGQSLGFATGFVIGYLESFYVITNWHVVTGRNADTNKLLDQQNAAIPDSIKIRHHSKHQFGEWIETEEELYDPEGEPRWLEHPSGREIDVVAIPVTKNNDISLYPLDFNLINTDVVLRPAMLTSIIGFPLGLSSTGWPIWKTGHIASDPMVDYDGRRMFLIDATTRSGMSGSPVILRISSGYSTADGRHLIGGPMVTKFLGVYSGRIRSDVEVGRVWKPRVITEIFIK
ncbi:S1 family peptidase [Paenibacillus timonensis]|uniref:S1 family peptidase n=1 Tax=Paenibacillus timonensis TaxID=225915 RepID=UPI003F95A3BC